MCTGTENKDKREKVSLCSHTLIQPNNFLDVWADRQPHALTLLDDIPPPLQPITDAENTAAVPNHLGKLIALQRPLELAHDRQQRTRNGQRRRLDVWVNLGLVEVL